MSNSMSQLTGWSHRLCLRLAQSGFRFTWTLVGQDVGGPRLIIQTLNTVKQVIRFNRQAKILLVTTLDKSALLAIER